MGCVFSCSTFMIKMQLTADVVQHAPVQPPFCSDCCLLAYLLVLCVPLQLKPLATRHRLCQKTLASVLTRTQSVSSGPRTGSVSAMQSSCWVTLAVLGAVPSPVVLASPVRRTTGHVSMRIGGKRDTLCTQIWILSDLRTQCDVTICLHLAILYMAQHSLCGKIPLHNPVVGAAVLEDVPVPGDDPLARMFHVIKYNLASIKMRVITPSKQRSCDTCYYSQRPRLGTVIWFRELLRCYLIYCESQSKDLPESKGISRRHHT